MGRTGDVVLTLGALAGTLCLIFATASTVFDMRLLIFRSGSMAPAIDTGSLAVAREIEAADVSIGDVVSVETEPGDRVTHRVTAIEEQAGVVRLTLQGDANPDPDPAPYAVATVDRVVFDVPVLGRFASWLAGPGGAVLGFIIVIVALRSLLRGDREDRNGGQHRGPSRRYRSRPPGRAAVRSIVVVLLGGTLIAQPVAAAPWFDTASAGSGVFQALSVPAPTGASCQTTGGVLGAFSTAVISWSGVGAGYSYRVDLIRNSDGEVVESTETSATTLSITTDLLGNLLSQNFTARIRAFPASASSWTSSGTTSTLFRSRTAGLGTACGNL